MNNAQAVSQQTAIYRDLDGNDHTVITKVFEKWDAAVSQWRVTSICVIYPDAEPILPVSIRERCIVPADWSRVSETFDYSRQAIRDTPS